MYNNLYNVAPIFYLICVMNIFFDSVINFIICGIPIVSDIFHHVSPHVSPHELWLMYRIYQKNTHFQWIRDVHFNDAHGDQTQT